MPTLKYKRVLLKLSGEALAGENKTGIDPETVATICREIGKVLEMGVEMALVIGGGNIFRGLSGSAKGMERSSADYMGMIATVLNALAVQDMLEKLGYPTRVLSAITMQEVCEPFIRRRALRQPRRHLRGGRQAARPQHADRRNQCAHPRRCAVCHRSPRLGRRAVRPVGVIDVAWRAVRAVAHADAKRRAQHHVLKRMRR